MVQDLKLVNHWAFSNLTARCLYLRCVLKFGSLYLNETNRKLEEIISVRFRVFLHCHLHIYHYIFKSATYELNSTFKLKRICIVVLTV